MTDSAGGAPRPKITYATLRADNEELHAAFEAGVDAARARLGQPSTPTSSAGRRGRARATFELRSPIDRDILVGRFARGTRRGRARRHRRRACGAAGLAGPRLGGPHRDPPPRRRPHQRAPHGVRRPDVHRGRQEPHRVARARSRRAPTCCATTPRPPRRTTSTSGPWTTSATRPRTPARSCGRTASSASSRPSTSPWPSRPVRRARPCWPATPASSSPPAPVP